MIFSLLISILTFLARNKCKCHCHCGCGGHCGCPPCNHSENCGILAKLFIWIIMFFLHMHESPKKHTKPRVAYVSVYNTPCGIATYNQELLAEYKNDVDLMIFAEYANAERKAHIEGDPDNLIRCWSRHDHPKVELIKQIIEWEPEIVHFSHEYGLFPKAYLFTSLVTWLKEQKIRVVATMHSVYDHIDKVVSEAAVDVLIVHTDEAKQCLINKGIDKNKIHVIPHGTNVFAGDSVNPGLLSSLWNTWGNEHTLFQPGFLFDYKGHFRMLSIIADLKEKYPDIHYIVQASENPLNAQEHERVYRKFIQECKRLGLESNVTINRGFVSKDVLLSYIRTVKAVVLPYVSHPEHEVRATSGSARLVLGTETPLITSAVHLFDDITGVALKGSTDQEIYGLIDNLFTNSNIRLEQNVKKIYFLKKTAWPVVAKQFTDLYHKLLN